MGRILAIDYGFKRCGIAVTDVLGMIPGGLCTVATHELMRFLTDYIEKEPVGCILVGYPRQMNGQDSETMLRIRPFVEKLRTLHPSIPIEYEDERFSSILAQRSIIQAGIPKMKRRNKGLVDEVSAVIILQSYLDKKDLR